MHKKYIVHLTSEARERLRSVVKKRRGSSQKVRRSQVLLNADANGTCWTDVRIVEETRSTVAGSYTHLTLPTILLV